MPKFPAPSSSPEACEKHLQLLRSMGALVGDFYLLLGREWKTPAERFLKYGMGEKRACYQNAFNLAQDHPELIYCEGFAKPANLFPIHHAWCVTADGEVVDPTWPELDTNYFGIPLQSQFVTDYVLESGMYGVLAEHVPRKLIEEDPSNYVHEAWPVTLKNSSEWMELVESKIPRQRPRAA